MPKGQPGRRSTDTATPITLSRFSVLYLVIARAEY